MKISLVGSNGMLARDVNPVLKNAGHEVIGLDLPEFDIRNPSQI